MSTNSRGSEKFIDWVTSFFRLFCCPPCPFRRIAEKMAFHPPSPSYSLSDGKILVHPEHMREYEDHGDSEFEAFYTMTSRGHNIACMYVKCCDMPRKTLLFSNGNAVDMGRLSLFYSRLGRFIECNIFTYDYSGYGKSEGNPSEENLYADIEAAWIVLQDRYNLRPKDIVLYGKSIGTVPTIDLASRFEVAGVVLHSPLMSGIRVLFPEMRQDCFLDSFVSTKKIPKIKSPVLIIHGTQDDVVDFQNGLIIYDTCPTAVDPLWVFDAGHEDIEQREEYITRLDNFLRNEVED